jgi:transglutaminase-like putative cysteine protease
VIVLEEWSEVSESGKTVRTQRVRFPSVKAEIDYLRTVVDKWRGTTWARELATRIVFDEAGCERKQRMCHAIAIGEWAQREITYVNELPETFQSPRRTVEFGRGDCDDATVVVATLLEAIGIPTKLVGMKVNGRWRHIFPVALVRLPAGKIVKVPLDTTLDVPISEKQSPIRRAKARGQRVEVYAV